MPHVIGLMLLGAGLYLKYRALVRAAARLSEELQRRDEEEAGQPVAIEKDLGRLEFDPTSGVYRPARRP